MDKVSTRFEWTFITHPDGDVQTTLTCLAQDPDVKNKRSAKPGATVNFKFSNRDLELHRINDHMMSMTDDQLDSCFPQERKTKNKV